MSRLILMRVAGVHGWEGSYNGRYTYSVSGSRRSYRDYGMGHVLAPPVSAKVALAMSGSCYRCVCCHAPAVDEYHWWEDDYSDGQEIVWHLCEGCCEFAISVVECVANIEEELAAWIRK
jgi:hypothetical protein